MSSTSPSPSSIPTVAPLSLSLPTHITHTLTGHTGSINTLRFNHDGNYALSGSQDRTLKLWNVHKGTCIHTYTGVHGYDVMCAVILSDNSGFISAGGDRVVYTWDISTSRVIKRMRGHEQRINSVATNPEGSVIVSGSYDKSVRVWDVRAQSRDAMQILAEATDSVTSVVLTGKEIVSGCVDGRLRTYDIRMGKLTTDYICHEITSVRPSHDAQCLLLSCLDSTARLFDHDTGALLQSYKGHIAEDYRIESCLTSDDAHVVSGSEDGKVYFWDLVDGSLVHTLGDGHTKAVMCLDYHPKDACLITGGADHKIQVWKR